MSKKIHNLTVISIVFITFLLTNCSTVSREQTNPFLSGTPFKESADTYLAQADKAPKEDVNELKIKAAGRLIYDRHINDGVRLLKKISTKNVVEADEKRVLLAKANIMVNQPKRASYHLARVRGKSELPPFYQALYRHLLIHGYEKRGRPIEAINERIKLDKSAQPFSDKLVNREKLWLELIHMSVPELQTLAIEASDPVTQGWASLAIMAQKNQSEQSISQWQSAFPEHSANQLLYPIQGLKVPFKNVEKVALLLPLSGKLSGPGRAIRDGFYEAKQQNQSSLVVQVYDVAQGDVKQAYRQAIQNGADMVIGPVSKSRAEQVAQMPHPVPTILLNQVDGALTNNAWQFGLSPIREAKKLAEKISHDGYQHPLVINTKGKWGERVITAFQQQWHQQGHSIVDQITVSKETAFNPTIRQFLHIQESAEREKGLRRLLGRSIKGNLRRRQDFDSVVILTHSSKARQIVPLLKYYYLGDVPVFGISAIYSPELRVADNRDLDGVIFPDVSHLFQEDMIKAHPLPEKLNSYNRLFAIGRDSFQLTQKLSKVAQFPAVYLQSGDDTVTLSTPKEIAYQLNWGQLQNGKVRRIS